jgi:hypothetical protein
MKRVETEPAAPQLQGDIAIFKYERVIVDWMRRCPKWFKDLTAVVRTGSQETLKDIPLPQMQLQREKCGDVLVLYSSEKNASFHVALARRIALSAKALSVDLFFLQTSVGWVRGQEHIRFLTSRFLVKSAKTPATASTDQEP